jgi:hypothetical protein
MFQYFSWSGDLRVVDRNISVNVLNNPQEIHHFSPYSPFPPLSL